MESLPSFSVVPQAWAEMLRSKAEDESFGLFSLIVEQGRLSKAKRRPDCMLEA